MPTLKPIALVADAIKDCTRRGDLIVDPFLRSGTTLLAAERVGRKAYGMDVDPLLHRCSHPPLARLYPSGCNPCCHRADLWRSGRSSRLRKPEEDKVNSWTPVPPSGTTPITRPDVGYGRPPTEHQFKPGKSGNRRGRPKGSKNEATLINEILNRKIEVRRKRQDAADQPSRRYSSKIRRGRAPGQSKGGHLPAQSQAARRIVRTVGKRRAR